MEITVAGSVCECVSVVLFQQVGCLCATELSLTLVLIQQTLPRGCSKFMRMCPRAKKKKHLSCGSVQGYPLAKTN